MEVTPAHRRVPVMEQSQSSSARYAAREAAEFAGFDEENAYRVGIVATELATNLVKHTSGGELLVRAERQGAREVELLAIDRGPGMADVARCLSDGHSTTGSPGTGLGAVRRLADEFDIYSQPDRGTVVMARLRASRASTPVVRRFEISGISVAKAGETACGDAWQAHQMADSALLVLADGLGHGVDASEASQAAVATIDPRQAVTLPTLLERMHDGLRHTRGAAAALADLRPGLLRFAGIGNIAGAILGDGSVRHAVSSNGTLGHVARQFREYSYPWATDSTLVMHSDGLGTHWSLDAYPGIRQRSASVAAAVLYRDHTRHHDDVTVVVGRERP
jgi:anti-sigma regulatory factor (Ser/Thr protein kinase)